ncbi:MAG: PilZ domain-containing protein [Planctomycetes bacterium]|nr:PilZ domain-containing protein [Planctomycetota bacterium]
MSPFYEQERREFIRIKTTLTVRYKFFCSHITDPRLEEIYQGITNNISAGGILLDGTVPNLGWLPDLLTQKIVIGINIMLPTETESVKALTRVAWIDSVNEVTKQCKMGLKFKEITSQDSDKIMRYIIRAQLPS